MLQTTELTFAYAQQPPIHFPALAFGATEQWLVLGASGCGKTTLLHLLSGLLTPRNGEVIIANQRLQKLSSSKLDRFRGKHIGIVFQQPHFIRSLTVIENLYLAQSLAGLPKDKTAVNNLLERLSIAPQRDKYTYDLSVGEQQRAAIARALLNRPALLLADEPTSALDDENSLEVVRLLEEHAREQGATLVIVTHDQRLKKEFLRQIILK